MKRSSKIILSTALLVTVFLVSYAIAFVAISLVPFGHDKIRVYSNPEPAPASWSNSSYWGGPWQYIDLGPETGQTNVACDTLILIEGLRPLQPVNLTFSPALSIAKDSYETSGPNSPPSSAQAVYPTGLLLPDTTYNVTATTGNTTSWWSFTTSSGPSQLTFAYPLASYDPWIALIAAIAAVSVVSFCYFVEKNVPKVLS